MIIPGEGFEEEKVMVSCLTRLYEALKGGVKGLAVTDAAGKVRAVCGEEAFIQRVGLAVGKTWKNADSVLHDTADAHSPVTRKELLPDGEGLVGYLAPFGQAEAAAHSGVLVLAATAGDDHPAYGQILKLVIGCLDRELALARQIAEAQQKMIRDDLTDSYNRRFLLPYLQELCRDVRQRQKPFSLILLDVDYFKEYNDWYGHVAGDECLKRIAERTRLLVCRSGDAVARVGGEEFAVVLPETGRAGACRVAERIRRGIADLHIPHARSPIAGHVTISAGVTTVLPDQQVPLEQVWIKADRALYQAKKSGRNRIGCV